MEKQIELALQHFDSGKNCTQSVLIGCSDIVNYDLDQVIPISSGFGGGMGSMGLTCGAVTGAFMALSFHNDSLKVNPASQIQEFSSLFNKEMKTLSCKDLTGCNFLTDEGIILFGENNIRSKVCHKCIRNSISIVNYLVSNNSNS